MTTETVHLVVKSASWAIPYSTGGKTPKPYFEIAAALPADQPFTEPADDGNLYEPTEVESASGERWNIWLKHNKSREDEVHIIQSSELKTIARQWLNRDVEGHLKKIEETHVKIEKLKVERGEEEEMESCSFTAHQKRTLEGGKVSKRFACWWEVVAVSLQKKEDKAQVQEPGEGDRGLGEV